jgi:hypothetical protein
MKQPMSGMALATREPAQDETQITCGLRHSAHFFHFRSISKKRVSSRWNIAGHH